MIFITGPLYSGKREYARLLLGCTREELAQRAVWDVQELAAGCGDLAALAQQLARSAVVRVFCGIPVYLKGAPNT